MVTGVSQLENALLKQLPEIIEKRLKEAMEKAAEQVVAQMKTRAPVYAGPDVVRHDGSPIRPGALRDSIGWTWGDAPKGTVALGAVQTGLKGEGTTKLTIYAGNKEAFYARWVEFGTRKWKTGNPFFFATWRNNKRKVRGQITRALRKAIKEAIANSKGVLA